MLSKKLNSVVKVTAVLGGMVGLFYSGFALADSGSGDYLTMAQLASNVADAADNSAKMIAGIFVVIGVCLFGLAGYYIHHHGKVRESGGQSKLHLAIILAIAGFISVNLSPFASWISGSLFGDKADIEHTNGSEMEKLIGSGGKS